MKFMLLLTIALFATLSVAASSSKKYLFSDKFENGLNHWQPSRWWPTDFTADESVIQRDGYVEIKSTHLRTTQTPFNNYVVSPAYEPKFGNVRLTSQDRYVSLKLVLGYEAIPGTGEAEFFGVDPDDYRLGMGYIVFSNLDLTDIGEFFIGGLGITNNAIYGVLLEGFVKNETNNFILREHYGIHKLCDYTKGDEVEFIGTFDLRDQSITYTIDGEVKLQISKSEFPKLFPSSVVDIPVGPDYARRPTGVWELQLMPMLRALPYTGVGEPSNQGLVENNWAGTGYNLIYPTNTKYTVSQSQAFGRRSSFKLYDAVLEAK